MLSPLYDPLFKLAETNPKLMDELKNSHMLEYWMQEYFRLAHVVELYYPHTVANMEQLRWHKTMLETAEKHLEFLRESGPRDDMFGRRVASAQIEMHSRAIVMIFKQVEDQVKERFPEQE